MHLRLTTFLFFLFFAGNVVAQTWVPVCTFNTDINDIINYGNEIWVGGNSLTARWSGSVLTEYTVTGANINRFAVESPASLYAAGNISFGNFSQVARWDDFQDQWLQFGNANEPQTAIYSPGSGVFIGGVSGLVLSGTEVPLTQFDTLSTALAGAGGYIYALNKYKDTLYVCGSFSTYNNTTIGPIAKWNGLEWKRVGGAVNVQGSVYCMAEYAGEFYIGGSFFLNNGSAFNIAKWNGNTWLPVGNGIAAGANSVRDMVVFENELYVVGNFSQVDNMPCKNAAKWDGTAWHSLSMNTNSGYLSCVDFRSASTGRPHGEVYAGSYGEGQVNHLYRLNYASTGVDVLAEKPEIVIFPQPAVNQLQIFCGDFKPERAFIINCVGNKSTAYSNPNSIDVSGLPSGLYILQLENNIQTVQKKFIKL